MKPVDSIKYILYDCIIIFDLLLTERPTIDVPAGASQHERMSDGLVVSWLTSPESTKKK